MKPTPVITFGDASKGAGCAGCIGFIVIIVILSAIKIRFDIAIVFYHSILTR